MEIQHIQEEGKGRFVVIVNGVEAGYLKYTILSNGTYKADGTLVYDAYRDQKLGTPLFTAFINYVKEHSIKVFPTCPFVVKMFAKHPEYNDLLDANYSN